MIKTKPFIHLFHTQDNYYIYDVNKNIILNTKENDYELLDSCLKNEGMSEEEADNVESFIEAMNAKGYLLSNHLSEIIHPADEILEYYLESKLSMISLQVTQQCNLRCKYCIYSGIYPNRVHTNQVMSFETAKKAIEFFAEHSREVLIPGISFYGGEPLLQFDLIKRCIEYALEYLEGKKLIFNLTTNATLLNDDIVSYFEKHNVYLLISLDGPEGIHDHSRKFISGEGSFKTVIHNLKNIKQKHPNYMQNITLNAVLNQNSSFQDINTFFTENEIVKELKLSVQFVRSESSNIITQIKEDFETEFNAEVSKLYSSLMGKSDPKKVSKIVKGSLHELTNLTENLNPTYRILERGHPSGPCIPGVHRPFIDVHGNIFPCERVNETSSVMKLGDIYHGFEIAKIRTLLNIGKISKDHCQTCWAFSFCNLCAASADDGDSLSTKKKISNCDNVRNHSEALLKVYCELKENGVDFDSLETKFN